MKLKYTFRKLGNAVQIIFVFPPGPHDADDEQFLDAIRHERCATTEIVGHSMTVDLRNVDDVLKRT